MLCAASLLAASYLSVIFNPADAWFLTVFGLLFAPFALLNLFLLIWSLCRRSTASVIPLAALVPAAFMVGHYYQFRNSGEELSENTVKMVSYNVGRFRSSSRKSGISGPEACADSVARMLRDLDADIICLQEFYFRNPSEVGSYLRRTFKGYNVEYFVYPGPDGCFGNVTLSRFPLSNKRVMDFEKSANLAISCDCRINGTDVRVYNCHFQSYNISLPHIVSTVRGDYREAVRYTEGKLRRSIVIRPRQVDLVMDSIESSPMEAIVAGDFNDTPASYTYHRLSKDRKDSFVEAGKGFGATFSALRPFLRIDYILFPKGYGAVSHEVLELPFSDHYPVVTRINIRHRNTYETD